MANQINASQFSKGGTTVIPKGTGTASAPIATTNIFAGASAISAITSAYTAFEAGRMRKIAFEHEAAMNEINARSLEIDAQFLIADKTSELAETLALQNVIAAASGRTIGVGSQRIITEASISNLEQTKRRIEVTGKARSVSSMMQSSAARASGEQAAKFGLLSSFEELIKGGLETARFIQ
jgi:hypothetical protein